MKQTRILWDMPITVAISDKEYSSNVLEDVYMYFQHVDDIFNTFKPHSEISRVNRGELQQGTWSSELTEVIRLCEKTKNDTNGYFIYQYDGELHPLGLVKGWAVQKAASTLDKLGIHNFYIDAGGDAEVRGKNERNEPWSVGIRNPFYRSDIVKKLQLSDCGIATSGTYIRGYHIYGPGVPRTPVTEILSLTVIGPNVFEADRYVTAAFAMGKKGIEFISSITGLEGYLIDNRGVATYTKGFDRYVDKYGPHRVD